jgi:hypothetical protein
MKSSSSSAAKDTIKMPDIEGKFIPVYQNNMKKSKILWKGTKNFRLIRIILMVLLMNILKKSSTLPTFMNIHRKIDYNYLISENNTHSSIIENNTLW